MIFPYFRYGIVGLLQGRYQAKNLTFSCLGYGKIGKWVNRGDEPNDQILAGSSGSATVRSFIEGKLDLARRSKLGSFSVHSRFTLGSFFRGNPWFLVVLHGIEKSTKPLIRQVKIV
jgi:hypothetical protein